MEGTRWHQVDDDLSPDQYAEIPDAQPGDTRTPDLWVRFRHPLLRKVVVSRGHYDHDGARWTARHSSVEDGDVVGTVVAMAWSRIREIQGFAFDNVSRAATLAEPELPTVIPIIFHGNKRKPTFSGAGIVCLPLYKVIESRTGTLRYTSADSLADRFGIARGTKVMLTGTSTDPFLERWWSLGGRRVELIRSLLALKITLVTTPNYSLFTDQPRWDDLHSMKRIALVHQEFLGEGMPAALHVNARTERDWERWRDFITGRPEITHIAFEFATGAGWEGRLEWYAIQLVRLAESVHRPLHLVVRGGTLILKRLVDAFTTVTCLESSTFIKTMRRKVAVTTSKGGLRWQHAPTEKTELLDNLLAENWSVVSAHYDQIMSGMSLSRKAA